MAATPVGMKRFYAILAGVAVLGLGALGFLLSRPKVSSIPANVTIQPSDTAGFRGYVKGSADAPVEITEYADYQCPFCQTFATLQMPTIEERLIRTGRLRWRYRDFPLQQHEFARPGGPFGGLRRRAGQVLGAAREDLRGAGRVVRGGRGRSFPDLRAEPSDSTWPATTSAWSRASTPAGSRRASRRASGRAWPPRRRCSSATGSIRGASIPMRSDAWSIRWHRLLHERRGGRGDAAREPLSVH